MVLLGSSRARELVGLSLVTTTSRGAAEIGVSDESTTATDSGIA